MHTELSAKIQVAIWWITSIAVSVVCCSILFVLFASYLVEVKESVKDNSERVNVIQEREDRILDEISMLRKHLAAQPAAGVQAPSVSSTDAPAALSVDGPGADKTPAASEMPAVSTPTMPVTMDKK